MDLTDFLTGLAIAVGLVGIVVPLLPGTALVACAVLVWALLVSEPLGWAVAVGALFVLAVGTVAKYAVPGRRLRDGGVPRRTLAAGAVLGVVGFFVVPVVGLVLGFVLGVYLSEAQRLGSAAAWPATKHALKAVGLSLLIELVAGLAATGVWVAGALST